MSNFERAMESPKETCMSDQEVSRERSAYLGAHVLVSRLREMGHMLPPGIARVAEPRYEIPSAAYGFGQTNTAAHFLANREAMRAREESH